MAPSSSHSQISGFALRTILEKDKLNDTNFTNWYRNLRIVLKQEKKDHVLDNPLPDEPNENATVATTNAYRRAKDESTDISCLMLAHMEPDLQKQFEHVEAYDMIESLKSMFQAQAKTERYQVSQALLSCKLKDGDPLSPHVIKMVGYVQSLERLGYPISEEFATDIILNSLPSAYGQFISNYHMHGMDKKLTELHGMLKQAEADLKKGTSQVLMVQNKAKFKKSSWTKKKAKSGGKQAQDPVPSASSGTKPSPSAGSTCFYCKADGHWKRNCSKYLADKAKSGGMTYDSGTLVCNVIDIYLADAPNSSWVYDTGSVIHICNSLQGLVRTRSVARGEVDIRVGNKARVAALEVGTMQLHLPSGFIMELNNCYYVPVLSRNIISASCLMRQGYESNIKNNGCSLYLNDMFHGFAPVQDGLFILNLDGESVYNINVKRLKPNDLNMTYFWHCRLGHISWKRMKKLHDDGLLTSFDLESFETCESCLLGKMTKTPFAKSCERASDLLGLVHSDVCGPMSTTARGGYEYFITFTDDLSRYGYIYLMKHKSEAFEKFKEFQNEAQNQLGKKIKFLRSDRGGEYMSHEFDDHLKSCGIVPQLTPPGTPQRNGVSERRNRTLLDMVRSMMSRTDLPLSFWGYCLETAAFTLNRVPSKLVEKTPHEMWTGKKPSLSFLKIWGCEAFVKRLQSDKLTAKSDKCIFVGYPRETLGYYFYNREEGKVFVARNGVFLEKEFLSRGVSGSTVQLEEIREEPASSESAKTLEVEPVVAAEPAAAPVLRRSARLQSVRDVLLLDSDEPANYLEAMVGSDSESWLGAMRSELKSMDENQVWNLVDLPDGARPVECKWVFKKKTDMDGNVSVYKACLVAKGFRQVQGVDYDETFSPVAMLK